MVFLSPEHAHIVLRTLALCYYTTINYINNDLKNKIQTHEKSPNAKKNDLITTYHSSTDFHEHCSIY